MAANALVVGATGLVGSALLRALRARGLAAAGTSRRGAAAGDHLPLDITDAVGAESVLAQVRPEWVFAPAADPYVDGCEREPERTRRVNVEGTALLARLCRGRGARMVFYSSDYVFDGAKGVYDENDPVRPINEYGRQKADAERAVLGENPANLVVRTSGVYGWQTEPKNFVMQVVSRLRAGQTMKVAVDARYNPTYADDLAALSADLALSDAAGIYHVAGSERLARYDFAVLAARAFALDESLLVRARAADFPSAAPRPRESSLSTRKLRARLGREPLGASEGLRAMKAAEPAR